MNEFMEFYKGKRVLLTGHTGFKGGRLSVALKEAGADVYGYALEADELSLYNICGLDKKVHSEIGDIRDRDHLLSYFEDVKPEVVFHLAAQPIVRQGYEDPAGTYETNLMGAVNLLECVRLTPGVRSVIMVTTDKVYRNENASLSEDAALDGYDPYSNSKSCAELASATYKRAYLDELGVAVSTMRAGNTIGGGDYGADRLIPDCIRAAESDLPIKIRHPESVRPYQHVSDAIDAYMALACMQYEDMSMAGAYNIGPGKSTNTEEIVRTFCDIWNSHDFAGRASYTVSPGDGPKEESRLSINSDKINSVLGSRAERGVRAAIEEAVLFEKKRLAAEDMYEFIRPNL